MTPTDHLICAEELRGLIASDAESPLVVDVRYRLGQPDFGREQYRAGHIAGSVFVDVETGLSSPRSDREGGRHPLPGQEKFQAVMRRAGLHRNQPVVAVDAGDHLAAARLWWLLRHHGHPAVRVLDGGIPAWTAAGGELVPEAANPSDTDGAGEGDFVATAGRLPVVTADEIPGLLAAGRRLVDVRAAERFRGQREPIDPVAGHIPGAENRPAAELLAQSGGFVDRAELHRLLGDLREGDALSCGSGLTATQVMLAAEIAGVEGLSLYAGSWSDWITNGARGIAVGI
ncbi:sulfurtransferase [Luteococcus sp. Sow4_B9]|uniref:sulfurtransferase n=1 Tax=Luteococcus sp. Sow4_B9 TaxID=3438792 RepID=UPI003F9929F6